MSDNNNNNNIHNCNQKHRFDFLEEAVTSIKDSLKKLTDLLIAKAESDTRMACLVKASEDHEERIRSLEAKASVSQWVERLVWAITVGAVLAYFNLKL